LTPYGARVTGFTYALTPLGKEFVEQLQALVPGDGDQLKIVVEKIGDITCMEIEGDAQIIGEAYHEFLVNKLTEDNLRLTAELEAESKLAGRYKAQYNRVCKSKKGLSATTRDLRARLGAIHSVADI